MLAKKLTWRKKIIFGYFMKQILMQKKTGEQIFQRIMCENAIMFKGFVAKIQNVFLFVIHLLVNKGRKSAKKGKANRSLSMALLSKHDKI